LGSTFVRWQLQAGGSKLLFNDSLYRFLILPMESVQGLMVGILRRWCYGIGVAGMVLLVPGMVLGQAPLQADLTTLSIEDLAKVKVFSASRHVEEVREAPSSVTVIPADEIHRQGWRTLGEVLGSVRGFYTAYDRNYTYLGVRGFLRPGDYNSRILLLIDGHRLNENVYDSALLGTEFPLDLELVERIEVVRGPSSSLYGTNALFGVINVITRRPESGLALESSGDAGSFESRTGRLGASWRSDRLSLLASGSLYRSAGQARLFFPEFASPGNNGGIAENLDGDRYEHAFADAQVGNWRAQFVLGSRLKVVPTASFSTNFNDPGTRTTDTRGYVDLSYHRALSSGADVDVRTYYDDYQYRGTYAYGGTGSPGRYLNIDWGSAAWAGAEATVGRPMGRHRITAGAKYEYSFHVDQKNYDPGGEWYVNDHRTLALGAVFAEAELKLLPQLTVRAGGRWDYYNAYGDSFSPRLAAVYSPNANTALKYIFGDAFRAPNAYEAFYSDGVSLSPNPQLAPETIESQELVWEQQLSPWLKTMVDGYSSELHNLIEQVPDAATGLTHFVNAGRDQNRGVELEVEAERASGVEAHASYTVEDARDVMEQKRLTNSPRQMAKLNCAIPIRAHASASVELLYSSAMQSYQLSRVPSSFLANMTSSTRPLWGGWVFSASLYNVFDRATFSPAGPGLQQGVIPQDGRTYRVQVSYRLPIVPGPRTK
jgi:iron complex outermembrane receptor protein